MAAKCFGRCETLVCITCRSIKFHILVRSACSGTEVETIWPESSIFAMSLALHISFVSLFTCCDDRMSDFSL
jgi:hypothetical protein